MNWYNFLVKIKPDGKAFRSILNTKILLEVIANGIQIVQDYAVLTINDQIWYTNDNFDPEPWEERYEITVPDFSTLIERREIVKSYMLFPQYSNRLSLDYFQIQLNNAGYGTVELAYNTSFISSSLVRMVSESVNSGEQSINIPNGGYSDTDYYFMFQAYDSNGYAIFPALVSNDTETITFNMPQSGTISLLTLKQSLADPLKITSFDLSAGIDQSITIPDGGYSDTSYDVTFQAYDYSGNTVFPILKSKTTTEVYFDILQDATVTVMTNETISDDMLYVVSVDLAIGTQEINISEAGYIDDDYSFNFQAYDTSGNVVFPIFKSKTALKITLDMPQAATLVLKSFGSSNNGNEGSYLHANDFADEKTEFDIGALDYNSFVASGEISGNLYKNVISLLMSLKPPQVVLYDKIEVLRAIALDDNLAIAITTL